MPRGPRLDAPGTLHHVMVRAIAEQSLFRNDHDRDDFVARVAALVQDGAWTVYAWALLPNHAHLLVRTERRPLSRVMRALLTGYAGAFNRRHRRGGHLFQNRYKSIVVEEEPYFLELVRYLHLNPLRARVVNDLRALDRYPYTGHAAVMGTRSCPWQATQAILNRFSRDSRRARAAYRAFVGAGVPRGQRPDLQGGGLVRSAGGWAAVQALRRGREAYLGDERILGGSDFVADYLRMAEASAPSLFPARRLDAATFLRRISRAIGQRPTALAGGGRAPTLTRARAGLAYLWMEVLGRSGRELATALGVPPQTLYQAAKRVRSTAAEWQRLAKMLEID
jgi:REP element-mobilizing transposase RayT